MAPGADAVWRQRDDRRMQTAPRQRQAGMDLAFDAQPAMFSAIFHLKMPALATAPLASCLK